MALTQHQRKNFETLRRAVLAGDVALMECQLAATGEPVAAICAANRLDDGEIEFVPFAMLLPGDPYQALNPPGPEGGFLTQQEVHSSRKRAYLNGDTFKYRGILNMTGWTWDREKKVWWRDGNWATIDELWAVIRKPGTLTEKLRGTIHFESIPEEEPNG